MQVDVLGPVRVRPACSASEPLMGKERALLSLLALNVARTVPRIDCEIALWGDDPPRTAAESLRSHVSRLRRCLGSDSVATSADGYRLALPPDAVDAARLHSALVCDSQATVDVDPVTRRRRLADAENLWRGEPLLDLADTARRREQVEWLREEWEQVREARIEADLDLGRHAQVVEELQRALLDQPMRETRWRLLMLALYRSGRQVEALRAYQRCRTRLATEWGMEPSPPLQRLQWQILRQDPHLDPQPPEPPLVVPTSLTPTVGRLEQIERIAELLGSQRLVTLHGGAGVGKSRLAMEVARVVRTRFADGVWWVDLTAANDAAGVLRQVAGTLGVVAAPGVPQQVAIRRHLEHRAVLLILDNCEHVADVLAAIVLSWLDRAAALRVLATSRVRLRVSGETRWDVPPLEVPAARADTQQALESAAATLFLQLRGWRPADVPPATAAEIVRLCRALDGLPLALELAAARSHQMTVREINDGLDREFLHGPAQVARIDHHATVAQAIDWSYSTLSASCQRVLEWLSVFPADFDAPAAEAIAGAVPGTTAASSRRCVATLVESALLDTRTVGQDTRYRLLFVVRQFAAERLDDRGETTLAGRAFSSHYRQVAEEVGAGMNGPRSGAGLARVAREMANLRAALDWSVAHEAASQALPFVRAIGRVFWALPSDLGAELVSLKAIVEGADAAGADADALAWAWVELVTGAYLCGDLTWAMRACDRAETLFRQVGDQSGLGVLAWHRGAMQLLAAGDIAAARQVLRQGYRIGQEEGVPVVEAWCAAHLAQLDCFADAVTDDTAAIIARASEVGGPEDRQMQAHLLMVRALARYARDDIDRCLSDAAACETYSRRHHQVPYEQSSLVVRACALVKSGDDKAARAPALRAAQIALDTGNTFQVGLALQPLAAIAEAEGDAVRAAQLWGAATARAPVWPLFASLYRFSRTHHALGDGFQAEVGLGASLSEEQALALAVG